MTSLSEVTKETDRVKRQTLLRERRRQAWIGVPSVICFGIGEAWHGNTWYHLQHGVEPPLVVVIAQAILMVGGLIVAVRVIRNQFRINNQLWELGYRSQNHSH